MVLYSHLFQNFPQFVVIYTVDYISGKTTFENDKGNLEKENFCPDWGSDFTGKLYSRRPGLATTVRAVHETRRKTKEGTPTPPVWVDEQLKQLKCVHSLLVRRGVLERSAPFSAADP